MGYFEWQKLSVFKWEKSNRNQERDNNTLKIKYFYSISFYLYSDLIFFQIHFSSSTIQSPWYRIFTIRHFAWLNISTFYLQFNILFDFHVTVSLFVSYQPKTKGKIHPQSLQSLPLFSSLFLFFSWKSKISCRRMGWGPFNSARKDLRAHLLPIELYEIFKIKS